MSYSLICNCDINPTMTRSSGHNWLYQTISTRRDRCTCTRYWYRELYYKSIIYRGIEAVQAWFVWEDKMGSMKDLIKWNRQGLLNVGLFKLRRQEDNFFSRGLAIWSDVSLWKALGVICRFQNISQNDYNDATDILLAFRQSQQLALFQPIAHSNK